MSELIKKENPEMVSQQKFEAGMYVADRYINRSYLINLSNQPVIPMEQIDEELKMENALRLFHINRLVYDKKEIVTDKLISVYSSLYELGGKAILLINSDEKGIDFYLGAHSLMHAPLCEKVLKNSLEGNFPGSNSESLKTPAIREIFNTYLADKEDSKRNISSVSVVPSMRDKEKDKYVQGIEKFIDTMRGTQYSALFIASPVSKENLELRKRGLEELSSSISPFVKTSLAYGENSSRAVTEGTSENFSQSINKSISKTNGYNESSNSSTTKGSNSGYSFGGMNSGTSDGHTEGYSSGYNWSKSVTKGTTDTTGTGTNKSDTVTTGDTKTMTIEHINKSAENLLKTLDEQLKRIKDSEAFGLWDCAAYFVSSKVEVSVMAANTYKALVSGDGSSVENSYVNVWLANNRTRIEENNRKEVLRYLSYGLHPHFEIPAQTEFSYDKQIVTPGTLISGKELPLFMSTPQKSVSGLTVNSIAPFGRGVFTVDNAEFAGDLQLGHIFHMGKEEEHSSVKMDTNSFTSHCFIAGSTGSGKSNTTYVLLNEFYKKSIPFLVIEPAKGEYKNEFANLPDINIFSTNPRYAQMLRLNPFWFDEEHIHVLEHLDRLIEIFNSAWEMYAAMPAILKAAAEQIYVEKGWDILNSVYLGAGEPQYPTFTDLLRVLPEIIKTSGYSSDTQGDYTGALVTRVSSLANGITGQIFCSGYAIPDTVLFDENTIVDLSRVGSTETKALIMGILVMKLTEYRTAQGIGSNSQLRHITVLEEAHNLLKRTNSAQGQETANVLGKSVEMISNSIAEMRTYGEGFIIVDQSPTSVDISAIKNTNTKIIMRLPEKADCEAVGNAMALNEEQIKELAKLPTGVAAVMQNNWLETALVKVDKAQNDFAGECLPVNNETLNELRGTVVSILIEQYFRDGVFNEYEIKQKIAVSNAPKHKKQELLESALDLVKKTAPSLDPDIFSKCLVDIACCRDILKLYEKQLSLINTMDLKDDDLERLNKWHESVHKALNKTLPLPAPVDIFMLKTLIYEAVMFSGDRRYVDIYGAFYGQVYEPEDAQPQELQIEETIM